MTLVIGNLLFNVNHLSRFKHFSNRLARTSNREKWNRTF